MQANAAPLFFAVADPEQGSGLLADWTWLLGSDMRLLRFTICGDVFLCDTRDGAVHFLDVNGARLSRVTDTAQAFEEKLADSAFAADYVNLRLIEDLRQQGKLLKEGEVYGFRIPLSLGGELTLENVEVTDLAVHLSLAGQIGCQLKDVPDGAPIGKLDIRLPSRKPWWKFW